MATFVTFHEVDDVNYWLKSPRRAELTAAYEGVTWRTFVDPEESNVTGLIIEIPDDLVPMFQEMMESEEAQEAAKADGVRWETLKLLVEA